MKKWKRWASEERIENAALPPECWRGRRDDQRQKECAAFMALFLIPRSKKKEGVEWSGRPPETIGTK